MRINLFLNHIPMFKAVSTKLHPSVIKLLYRNCFKPGPSKTVDAGYPSRNIHDGMNKETFLTGKYHYQLEYAFVWDATPEGPEFWEGINMIVESCGDW